jgi:hypothetical protein
VGHLRVIEITDQTRFPSDHLTFFNNELSSVSPSEKATRPTRRGRAYNVTWDQLPGLDFLDSAVSHHFSFHGDVTLQAGDDIGGLLFLVPTDGGVEHQDADNDAKINPIAQTSGKKNSQFHD